MPRITEKKRTTESECTRTVPAGGWYRKDDAVTCMHIGVHCTAGCWRTCAENGPGPFTTSSSLRVMLTCLIMHHSSVLLYSTCRVLVDIYTDESYFFLKESRRVVEAWLRTCLVASPNTPRLTVAAIIEKLLFGSHLCFGRHSFLSYRFASCVFHLVCGRVWRSFWPPRLWRVLLWRGQHWPETKQPLIQ